MLKILCTFWWLSDRSIGWLLVFLVSIMSHFFRISLFRCRSGGIWGAVDQGGREWWWVYSKDVPEWPRVDQRRRAGKWQCEVRRSKVLSTSSPCVLRRLIFLNSRFLIASPLQYRFYGEQIVKACIEAGTHYVDISGEPHVRSGIGFSLIDDNVYSPLIFDLH